jgi:uncharacterized protein YjbJ (UPF0337 family)
MGSGEDRAKGIGEEVKGKAKQAWGDVTDDNKTRAEGQADELKGKGHQKMADAKDKVKDAVDNI